MIAKAIEDNGFAPVEVGQGGEPVWAALPSSLSLQASHVAGRCPSDFGGDPRPRDIDYVIGQLGVSDTRAEVLVRSVGLFCSERARISEASRK